jgi:serine/threonine protein kinase/tetratricopeptide (TPR) repeat protein
MNRLGEAPGDVLFGLIAVNNHLVAPAIIPGALRSRVGEPTRSLAELLVSQGALTPVQRDLVEALAGEYTERAGGSALRGLATLITTSSARERLDQLGDHEMSESLSAAALETTFPDEPNPQADDPERTLPVTTNGPVGARPRIAGYEILEVLGSGGMGIVYKARQERLDRFVALKMIRAGAGARPEDLARFESEAKAVAAIEHSNIVKIFEIAEQDGLPYFSLEYLSGGSLASKIGGKPQPVDEAARIVEVLANAMHVAHQHKVIHRDLKPANVLLAADGTLKISDFGLVKRLETDSGQTRSGSILGTPSYMAPEQARGEGQAVGPAADQYSLGAILYELLTGHPPFQGTSPFETLDMVRHKEPVAPSQLQPKTPRDLETICLKCLEKDIARRYPDVLALAEDLRRFRAGEPILARPVSDAERLWRWCQRNRRVAALSAAVALLLVIVTAGSAIANVLLTKAYTEAEERRQESATANVLLTKANTVAEERRQEAERKQSLAVAAARAANEQNRIAVEADVGLIMLFTRTLREVPAIQNVREETLDKTIKRLSDAAKSMTELRGDVDWAPKDEEKNWRSLARAYQAQAMASRSRNRFADAMKQFRQAEEIITSLAAADPNDMALQVNLLKIQRELGNVSMYDLGDTEGGQRHFRKAVEISRACHAKKPDDDGYKGELANSLGKLAGSEMALGHLAKARELYRQEFAVRASFSPAKANDSESRRELAGYYAELATLTARMGDLLEAQKLYDRCTSIRARMAEEKPDFWPAQNDLALCYNHQGTMRFPQGDDPKAARVFHRKALDVFRTRTMLDPADSATKRSLGLTLYYDATCALRAGDKVGADAGYHECLKIFKELDTDPKVKLPRADLMLALARCGEHAEAAKIAGELVATPPKDEGLYVQAACGFALAAGVVADGDGDDAALVKSYTDSAIDCLRKAKERGWADVESLKIDTDLEPIRKNEAFKTLLDEFQRVSGKLR